MIRRAREWLHARPVHADALLAVAVYALWLTGYLITAGPAGRQVTWGGLAVSALAVVPVVLRRIAPWASVGLLAAAILVSALLHESAGAESLSFLVVSYTAVAVLPLGPALWATALIAASTVVSLQLDRPPGLPSVLFSNALVLAVCFFLGRTVRTRRAYTRALEDRAHAAEESREAAAREAVLDERRRIARELHDVVAHHISVMGVLATGARRTLYRDPDVADETLRTIEDTGRTTLREMRRLLDVLRIESEPAEAPVEPQPGVAGLEALAAQVREAGLPVRVRVTGDPVALEPGVDLTVYRIVQEGLTNALKHAGPATADVRLTFTADAVELEVADDGRGPRPGVAAKPDGHGLVGMRERVGLYGGRLYTGPRTAGGFVVRATIPLDTAALEWPR
jgi:signal transduction histidine kinase